MNVTEKPDPKVLIWQVVSEIPSGKVASYGQVAEMAGLGRAARLVGRTLASLPVDTQLPWHRVINSQGKITHPDAAKQIERLRAEGVHITGGKITLKNYRWEP